MCCPLGCWISIREIKRQGHRFHAPRPIQDHLACVLRDYAAQRGYVLADFATRRELIRNKVVEVAASLGGTALIGDDLLDEVTALVEWPVPLAGRFEERFLELPREVLISTLQDHQRYFAVEDSARPAVAELHHGQQHREPRSFQGARG